MKAVQFEAVPSEAVQCEAEKSEAVPSGTNQQKGTNDRYILMTITGVMSHDTQCTFEIMLNHVKSILFTSRTPD